MICYWTFNLTKVKGTKHLACQAIFFGLISIGPNLLFGTHWVEEEREDWLKVSDEFS